MLLQRKIGESKNRNAPFSPLFSSFNMVLLCARRKLQKKIDTKDKKRLDTKIISINNVGFFVSPRFQLDTVSNQSDELPELRPMIDIPIEPSGDDLHTINQDVLSSLCTEQPGADSPVEQAVASCVLDVGEELIGTCVTPTKVRTVQQTLGSENEPHLCALKLLQSFFTTEEHATSNTDGTYGKKCLDSAKLNSLKVLVFTKFLVGNNEEKEKLWRLIKSNINSKCRSIRKFPAPKTCSF